LIASWRALGIFAILSFLEYLKGFATVAARPL
jgi:hypothetical protein